MKPPQNVFGERQRRTVLATRYAPEFCFTTTTTKKDSPPGKRMIPKSGVRFADDGFGPVTHAAGPRAK
jgi:hypothetical protein